MCGIAGAFLRPGDDTAAATRAMCEQMQRRGPDAAGEWHDPRGGLSLGHRRLSIIDLDPRANQPMVSADGRHVIVFNGEIYNYVKLRTELENRGVRFRTQGDTEVVLELYRSEGDAAFERLRGMFALAIWDSASRSLSLARDPYGIKPLYLAQTPRGALFASQVKALLASGSVSRAIDPAGVAGFFIWGSVPEPFTVFNDIRPVPAGSVVRVDAGGSMSVFRFADVAAAWATTVVPRADVADAVHRALRDSVRAHLVADVPIALFLSGGVDSGAIAGLTAERGQAMEGVTISFKEFVGRPEDEVPRARAIADFYGIKHTVRTIDQTEFLQDLPAILNAMDQPSIDGVNTWFASKAVAELGFKVVLSGVGGDELIAGYDTFRTVPRLNRAGRLLAAAGGLGGLSQKAFAFAAAMLDKPKIAGIPVHAATLAGSYLLRRGLMLPSELADVLGPNMAAEGLRSLMPAYASGAARGGYCSVVAQVAALESTHYLRNQLLRDSDWASMAHSLELRTPLVDWRLLQQLAPYAGSMAAGEGKRLLASAPQRPLPASVTEPKKTGFGLPLAKWLTQSPQNRNPLPPAMRHPWARQWAYSVAEAFGLPRLAPR